LDFLELPMSTRGHDYLLVLVDKLTKLTKVAATSKDVTAAGGAAELCIPIMLTTHARLPASLISDRDPRFTADLWTAIWTRMGTKLRMTVAHRPQADGQTERMNRTILEFLRHFVNSAGSDWDDPATLAFLEFSINAHVSESTGASPFDLHLGRKPVMPATLPVATGTEELPIAAKWQLAKDALVEAQAKMADLGGAPERVIYQAGEKVLLDTQRFPQLRHHKLQGRFCGPLTIARVLSGSTVELLLPASWPKLHPVVNVDSIKRFQSDEGAETRAPPPQPLVGKDGQPRFFVERLLRQRVRRGRTQYLVRWQGYTEEDDTWEPESEMRLCCPALIKEFQATLAPTRSRRGKGG
jgi:hypothetical protein